MSKQEDQTSSIKQAGNQTILGKIVATKHREIEEDKRKLSFAMVESLAAKADPVRGFAEAILARVARKEPAVIAEIKKASPSKDSYGPILIPPHMQQTMPPMARPVCRS